MQSYRYDSFGNITNQTGSLNQPYTYTGREYDPETGLYYYRTRYYDAKSGRFLQEDPIGFAGGINKYAYVYNNPLNLVDPYGLLTMPGTIAGACAAQWYANQQANSTSPFGWMWGVPGSFASLWTPQTWAQTSLTLISGAAAAPWAASAGAPISISSAASSIPTAITGMTKHGINQIINRGITPAAILGAVQNPSSVIQKVDQFGRVTYKYIGNAATVVLNQAGQIVTAWPTK